MDLSSEQTRKRKIKEAKLQAANAETYRKQAQQAKLHAQFKQREEERLDRQAEAADRHAYKLER